ncbi:hypothetical protein SOASR030_12170 [Leminorella grimontii]|uniref:YdgH/BhsA/McbA-like domain-containing protein n=1 Tax=Leminorella grimontii TaxID=82981 RepID=A0AAV5MZJ9_9GAMM|nr:DUF1471 domain-containing protein [Leminorella grimontii]KFC97534.1 hypothetical protein GLGR_0469 [Leminorella grimontii ATCC 33999 = DSM 5078]GKX55105.1 hypothetical protein SOASR030_12170 [Leminorella grimontii]GKX58529.1 hypothetical protein SOASR031_08440 [Leminorella grimontii]VFS56906.1 putative biofilm stress and motility protein A [Leminorella grimontii]
MKKSAALIALLFSLGAGSAMAATQVSSQQAQQLQSMGSISGSVQVVDMDQAVSAIAKKAESMNAGHYRVIAVDSRDNSNNWRISAELYR